MTRSATTIHITQPCSESWDAMTPTGLGRHCAACQKTVVDFTSKTDAEIVAYFAQASGSVCGRLWNDQLGRPLAAPVPLVATSRWRTWLAAALVAWAVREGAAVSTEAQTPAARQTQHPRKKSSRPVPRAQVSFVRGTVQDVATGQPVPGAAVFLQGENRRTTTDSVGRFRLPVPARWRAHRSLIVHFFGYHSQVVKLTAAGQAKEGMTIKMQPDTAAAGIEVVGVMPVYQRMIVGGGISSISIGPPAPPARRSPSRPRSFYEWLTRPFRRHSTT